MMKPLYFFRSAPHIDRLPQAEVDSKYKKLRWQVFIGIFIGYTCYYLLRNNFSLAMPHLEQQGFTKLQLGTIFSAYPLAYGFSKFIMGIFSDRCNPRYFMAIGLILSALINFVYGTNLVLSSISLMMTLMFLNGWVQGMGGPPGAKVMAHWFCDKERGTMMSVWATSLNIGSGIVGPLAILGVTIFSSWHSVFYFPAMFALAAAFVVMFLVRDTPQSEGLPPVEEYRNETVADANCETVAAAKDANDERPLTTKEILFKYVLNNKYLWLLAFANIFVYLVRYGVIVWTPTYLTQVKGFTYKASSWAYFLYEYAAIPGIILCGWISDKIFRGHRTQISIIYMAIVAVAVLFYWLMPGGHPIYNDIALIVVGFFIYGPVSLIGVSAVDLVPKKACGTAFGFVGLCGYLGGAMTANVGIGFVVDHFGWNIAFIMMLSACILSILFLFLARKPKVENVTTGEEEINEDVIEPESA